MIRGQKIDPRSKLIIVLCVSTWGLVLKDILSLFAIAVLSFIIAKMFGVDLSRTIKKIRGLLYMVVIIAIVQSIFSSEGHVIFSIGNFNILTYGGLNRGLGFILRIVIVLFSASILSTSTSREIIQGFVQWGLPYDIAFMVSLGIRFLPMLTEEIRDSLTAIQLRGISIKNIPIKSRISVYSYIFTPVLAGTILKAEKLATAIEMRGFRAYEGRTSYMVLKMSNWDYLIIFTSLIVTVLLVKTNFFL